MSSVLHDHCYKEEWGKAVALTASSDKTNLEGLLRYKDSNGDTALHQACFREVSHSTLSSLFNNTLSKGIDLKQILSITNNFGQLVLHWAARFCSVDVVKLVQEHSTPSSLTTKTNSGNTPLDWARKNNKTDNVKFLESVSNVMWDTDQQLIFTVTYYCRFI